MSEETINCSIINRMLEAENIELISENKELKRKLEERQHGDASRSLENNKVNSYKIYIRCVDHVLTKIIKSSQSFEGVIADLRTEGLSYIVNLENDKKALIKTENIILIEEA